MMERTVSLSKSQIFVSLQYKLITDCSHLQIFFLAFMLLGFSWTNEEQKKNKTLSCIGVGEANRENQPKPNTTKVPTNEKEEIHKGKKISKGKTNMRKIIIIIVHSWLIFIMGVVTLSLLLSLEALLKGTDSQ